MEDSVGRLLGGADLADSPAEVSPDRALVFEVIGPLSNVTKFIAAARGAGFEWLGEDYDTEIAEDEEHSEHGEGAKDDQSTLYVTMPTIAGLQKILSLWKRFVAREDRPAGVDREWWPLFGYLSDVRVWSAKDRVDPATEAYVRRELLRHPDRPVRIELDLWFRGDAALRAEARQYVEALLETVDGRLLDFATIEPIHYQAALVEVPGVQARLLGSLDGALANADRVMRVRPQSLYRTEPGEAEEAGSSDRVPPTRIDPRPPVAALLDGYPVQNHVLLANRLELEEVDVTGRDVPVSRRRHGTSMASLILHGDLANEEPPLDRAIKVVPILGAPQGSTEESTPLDRLPIALVYRAVMSLAAGIDGKAPTGPNVVVINHSICDREAPFAQRPSYWAKLLDHLSHEHRLLFVVSAGNSNPAFALDAYAGVEEFEAADPIERQIVLLRSVENAKGTRTILSPAEAMNALTVGAIHADGSTGCPSGLVDPYAALSAVTNLTSSVGLGINRGLKPDMVEHGGRQLVRTDETDGVVSAWAFEHPEIGQLAAMPAPESGRNDAQSRSTGTSNAAALVTRAAVRMADVIDALYEANGESWAEARTRAVVLKALLAHGCSWGDTGELLDTTYPGHWQRRREAITRTLGYGRPDHERVLTANGSRITLLADDMISHDVLHEYRLPIPRAMISNREVRRITMTLAWSSPIDPVTKRYRGVLVEAVDREGKRNFWNGVATTLAPVAYAGRRGTLQHIRLEGKKLMRASSQGDIFLGIQARADLSDFARTQVPYAVAVTLEMGQPVRQDLFADVLARVRTKQVAVAERVPTRIRT